MCINQPHAGGRFAVCAGYNASEANGTSFPLRTTHDGLFHVKPSYHRPGRIVNGAP